MELEEHTTPDHEEKNPLPETAEITAAFRTLFETAFGGIALHDRGKILLANSSLSAMTGYSTEELIGMNGFDLIAPEHREYVMQKLLDDHQNIYEAAAIKKNGNRITVEIFGRSVQYGGRKLRITEFRDISGKKSTENALAYEQDLMHALMDNIPDTIYFKDLDCRFIRINDAQVKILGVESAEDAIGKTDFDFFNAEAAAEAFKDDKRVMRTGIPQIGKVERLLGKNGWIWMTATKVPLRSKDGTIIGLVGVSRNVSAQIHSEEELKKANIELQKSNAEKDKFFSIIAHDLRSPFLGFLGLTELMIDDEESLSTEEMMRYCGQMYDSAGKLYKLLENLLEWSRLQRGLIKYTPASINLSAGIEAGIEALGERAALKNITLINAVQRDVSVYTDEKMLNSVLRNLISNGIKFTQPGGSVTLSAEACITNEIKISVTDTGIGISKETLEKLFKIDEKVSTPGTEGEPSSGLGLILCKEFIERMHGTIGVASEPGNGTVFYFTIPAALQ